MGTQQERKRRPAWFLWLHGLFFGRHASESSKKSMTYARQYLWTSMGLWFLVYGMGISIPSKPFRDLIVKSTYACAYESETVKETEEEGATGGGNSSEES